MSSTPNESSTPPPEEDISSLIARKVNTEGNVSSSGSNYSNPYGNELEFVIKQQFANSLEQNRRERIKYAKYTFWLTCSWIFFIMSFIFFSAFRYHVEKVLEISDQVLIVLIGTTTLNVFGFFILVMQFLFNKEEWAASSFLFKTKNEAFQTEATKPNKEPE